MFFWKNFIEEVAPQHSKERCMRMSRYGTCNHIVHVYMLDRCTGNRISVLALRTHSTSVKFDISMKPEFIL